MIRKQLSLSHIPGEDFFVLNLKYLFFVGLWPKEDWSKNLRLIYKIYEIVLHLLPIICCTLTAVGTYQNKDDLTIVLSNFDKILVVINYEMKVFDFVIKRKKIRVLIGEIQSSGDEISANCNKLMTTHVFFVTLFTFSVLGAFSASALLNGEMTAEAWMPFDPRKNSMNLFLSAQIIAVTFLPCSVRANALQGIVCSIIMYLCEQLTELQHRIKSLEYSVENETAMRAEFIEIVKKHVRLIRFSKSIEKLFQEYFLIQNLAVTLELCLNAVMVTVMGLEEKEVLASFLSCLMLALLNEYIYCYLGNKLMDLSEGIANAAYEVAWTSWPVEMQKNLLMVVMASQKTLKVSAGGLADMCMQTFGLALYNGYSVFAFLSDAVD